MQNTQAWVEICGSLSDSNTNPRTPVSILEAEGCDMHITLCIVISSFLHTYFIRKWILQLMNLHTRPYCTYMYLHYNYNYNCNCTLHHVMKLDFAHCTMLWNLPEGSWRHITINNRLYPTQCTILRYDIMLRHPRYYDNRQCYYDNRL